MAKSKANTNQSIKYFVYSLLAAVFMVTVALRAIDTGSIAQWIAVFLAFCLSVHFLGKTFKSLRKFKS